jgi:hypothetical protein
MEDFNTIIEKIMSGEKALSYSSLKQFLESPRHFKKFMTEPTTSKAMEEGKRFHMSVLETEKFMEKYWCLDDSEKVKEIGGGNPRATNLYKSWIQEERAKRKGMELIQVDEWNMYMTMKKSLYSNSETRPIMEALTEKESFMSIDFDGLKINMKIDGKSSDIIIDLKKVENSKYKKVKWKIFDEYYDMQGGLYSYATGIKNYKLIFIDPDSNISVVRLMETTLEEGFGKFKMAISKFIECAEQDLWNSSYEFWNGGYVNL